MIFGTGLIALAALAGAQSEREAAIASTQADVERYPYNENFTLTHKGLTYDISRAAHAGRCRTKFVLEEEAEVIVDWSGVAAMRPDGTSLALTMRRPADNVTFELNLPDETRNFAEVFDYLIRACAG
ncbi:hypothetical protein E2493_20585 [Sphingomonas parva]|uniref:Uncharacterized protein n=1 Tax=Sphingomonas parva TaxID=2555898 RepID=A0A4Y8ZMH6_9SPHN|nr:hypothetical protein [Sphingomonas parva]TFI56365.1 hypothetical protein E2493_20585 [Sphingomonas parva]